jgi:cytochrome c-type biogenesis protein CcmE
VSAGPEDTYDLTGNVVGNSVAREDDGLRFEIEDRDGSASVPVRYTGTVPDPFREGREVIVTGRLQEGTFVAEKDSLVTKCPSKFSDEAEQDPEHVIIEE